MDRMTTIIHGFTIPERKLFRQQAVEEAGSRCIHVTKAWQVGSVCPICGVKFERDSKYTLRRLKPEFAGIFEHSSYDDSDDELSDELFKIKVGKGRLQAVEIILMVHHDPGVITAGVTVYCDNFSEGHVQVKIPTTLTRGEVEDALLDHNIPFNKTSWGMHIIGEAF